MGPLMINMPFMPLYMWEMWDVAPVTHERTVESRAVFSLSWICNWWYWVSRGHLCLYILNKVEIWTGITDTLLTHWQTLKDSATQLLINYKSGALVMQKVAIYALLVCTFFGPKICLCNFFDTFHIQLRLRSQNQMLKSLLPTLSICGNVFGGRSHLLHHWPWFFHGTKLVSPVWLYSQIVIT